MYVYVWYRRGAVGLGDDAASTQRNRDDAGCGRCRAAVVISNRQHYRVCAYQRRLRRAPPANHGLSQSVSLSLSLSLFRNEGPGLQNILRQSYDYLTIISYDNAKVTIDSRRTSSLQNILLRTQGFS